eukprot:TRINITY_DN629_c0_g1_i1.p1 TRINITY_DN629_c0_g1~~TRINITY_DN629_c0_g1_i1.p1  ORF type:complete len:279 (+),score=29.75 TRINITY_DN629_c0_g1_i1:107-943(+)
MSTTPRPGVRAASYVSSEMKDRKVSKKFAKKDWKNLVLGGLPEDAAHGRPVLHRWIRARGDGTFELCLPGNRILRDKFFDEQEALMEIRRQLHCIPDTTNRGKGKKVPEHVKEKMKHLLSRHEFLIIEMTEGQWSLREEYYHSFQKTIRFWEYGNFDMLEDMCRALPFAKVYKVRNKAVVELSDPFARIGPRGNAGRPKEEILQDVVRLVRARCELRIKDLRKFFQQTHGYTIAPTNLGYHNMRSLVEELEEQGHVKTIERKAKTWVVLPSYDRRNRL